MRSQQVPGNLANFLKQASLDTAMAALQQREATPPTPHMRQLPSGAGAVWPFALGPTQVPSLRPGGMPQGGLSPSAQLDGSPQRLGTLNMQSPLLRSAPNITLLYSIFPFEHYQYSYNVSLTWCACNIVRATWDCSISL